MWKYVYIFSSEFGNIMKFFDEVNITVQSGKWWNGVATGRREKNIPYWGPSGWDGGRGGSIIFVGDENEWTLMPYRYNVMYRASPGQDGSSRDQYGKDSENVILKVPVGTLIKQTGSNKILAHIDSHGEEIEICRWGKWGLWNLHFVTAQRQYSEMHLLWEPWQKKQLTLELQMLADVALIGTPSVGKSTIINAVSNVKAKTAEYHFTTLVPNIWVVEHKGKSFVMIDIPGLIQWASDGKWLWSEFLRHILKSRILCFVIDLSKYEAGREEFGVLFDELIVYLNKRFEDSDFKLEIQNGKLFLKSFGDQELQRTKQILWILNKSDLAGDAEMIDEMTRWWIQSCRQQLIWYTDVDVEKIQQNTHVISAATRQWVDDLLDSLRTDVENELLISIIDTQSHEVVVDQWSNILHATEHLLPQLIQDEYVDPDVDPQSLNIRSISDVEVSQLVYMLPRGNTEAEIRFRSELHTRWILQTFEQSGIQKWDILHIISMYDGVDDRYILRE